MEFKVGAVLINRRNHSWSTLLEVKYEFNYALVCDSLDNTEIDSKLSDLHALHDEGYFIYNESPLKLQLIKQLLSE